MEYFKQHSKPNLNHQFRIQEGGVLSVKSLPGYPKTKIIGMLPNQMNLAQR